MCCHHEFKRLHSTGDGTSTIMGLISHAMDTSEAWFDDAPIERFWFPSTPPQDGWKGPWSRFEKRDPSRKETDAIQPAWKNEFIPAVPSTSPFELVDTHANRRENSQDCTAYVKGEARVASNIPFVIELVGQDNNNFPDRPHKQKIIRDMERIHAGLGRTRDVYAVVTDLSRIVCLKYSGFRDNRIVMAKTAMEGGATVHEWLESLVMTPAIAFGIRSVKYEVVYKGNPIYVMPGRCLGSGAQATVHADVLDENGERFIKTFRDSDACLRESKCLFALQGKSQFIPVLMGQVEAKDMHALVCTPVGTRLREGNSGIEFEVLGSVLHALKSAHQAGWVHRDVRPSNIITATDTMGRKFGVLLDWACATEISSGACPYSGTKRFASVRILQQLAQNDGSFLTPDPKDDLESLVFTFVCCWSRSFPLEDFNQLVAFADIANFWKAMIANSRWLQALVDAARAGSYEILGKFEHWIRVSGTLDHILE